MAMVTINFYKDGELVLASDVFDPALRPRVDEYVHFTYQRHRVRAKVLEVQLDQVFAGKCNFDVNVILGYMSYIN